MKILALDIASTTGFCIGSTEQNAPFDFGSIRFAKPGSPHQTLFGSALEWASAQLSIWNPDRLVYEAPLYFRNGNSRMGNDEILHGLPAVILAAAFERKIFDIHKAPVRDVRLHFIGCSPPRETAKARTVARCKQLRWEVRDHNEADACALWDYACAKARLSEKLARAS
jgi:hypothetical protein